MKLAVSQSGNGPRTAVLIHGIMADSRAWRDVTAELEQRGFRVLAVDLAGHGQSPRARRYSPTLWADDVVETLSPLLSSPPDLVMGHSLGALVLSLVADRMKPVAAVYVEPAFSFPRGPKGVLWKVAFAINTRPRAATLARMNPTWNAEQIEFELGLLRDWDRRTLLGFADTRPLVPPRSLSGPSLVVVAERSFLVTARVTAALRRLGMIVEVLPGTGHAVFQDDLANFVRVLDAWLARTFVPPSAH